MSWVVAGTCPGDLETPCGSPMPFPIWDWPCGKGTRDKATDFGYGQLGQPILHEAPQDGPCGQSGGGQGTVTKFGQNHKGTGQTI